MSIRNLGQTWPCTTCWWPYDRDRWLTTSACSRPLAWTSWREEPPSSYSWRTWGRSATRLEWRPARRRERRRRSGKVDQSFGETCAEIIRVAGSQGILPWQLTTERRRILDEAFNAELIPPSRKASSPENTDLTRRCRYHKNSGHSTEECQTLKDKIKELIHVGHLQRFVQGSRSTKRFPRASETEELLPSKAASGRPPTWTSIEEGRPSEKRRSPEGEWEKRWLRGHGHDSRRVFRHRKLQYHLKEAP